jgi:hypothetical protein
MCVLGLFLICGVVNTAVPVAGHAAGTTTERTLQGTVTAVNVSADPKTIVVNVVLPNKEELVVGARVSRDTKITRGKRAARLEDVTVGEMVTITYLKAADGLIARSIYLR